jgi:hypothetical protein
MESKEDLRFMRLKLAPSLLFTIVMVIIMVAKVAFFPRLLPIHYID